MMTAHSSAVDSSNDVKLARVLVSGSAVSVILISLGCCGLDGPPHFFRCSGHVDMADAEVAYGVDHG